MNVVLRHGNGLLLALMGLFFSASVARAQLTADDFLALEKSEQKNRVVSALELRMAHSRNLKYECTASNGNYVSVEGRRGKRLPPFWSAEFTYYRLGNVDRTDMQLENNGDLELLFSTTFDGDSNKRRSLIYKAKEAKWNARIDTTRGEMSIENRFRLWLDYRDWGNGGSEYIISYALEHADEFVISPIEDSPHWISVRTGYKPSWRAESEGTRKLVLDLSKGMLPIHGEFDWKNGRSSRHEELTVLESEKVGPVWMPTHTWEDITVRHSHSDNVHYEYHELKLRNVEHGLVARDDLHVPFPENTRVLDATKMMTYIVDADERPVGKIEPVFKN